MPPKVNPRPHPRELVTRAWGTRFDTLSTSNNAPSPSSPTFPPGLLPVASPATAAKAAEAADRSETPSSTHHASDNLEALGRELFADAGTGKNTPTERRSWADDEPPACLVNSFPATPSRAPAQDVERKVPGDASKMPHNASVFVGSLPPEEDEAEVARLLSIHLARYATIQNVKVIHDSKGGLCAFVQCETPAQALNLVTKAQTNTQVFMGRYPRYELARAFRSLWISYRTPMQLIGNEDNENAERTTDAPAARGRWAEMELPVALRIWKPRDSKFPNVSYVKMWAEEDTLLTSRTIHDPKGVVFANLKFDAATIEKLATTFGPLEYFRAYIPGSQGESATHPPGHEFKRAPCMDPGVWEVKFGHRDDCICALQTLRRVPHLTVTWANLQQSSIPQTPRQSSIGFRGPSNRTPASPRYPSYSYSPAASSPFSNSRPLLLLDRANDIQGSAIVLQSPSGLLKKRNKNASSQVDSDDLDDGWTVVRPQNNITRDVLSAITAAKSSTDTGSDVDGGVCDATRSPRWRDNDFPPLILRHMEHQNLKEGNCRGSIDSGIQPQESQCDHLSGKFEDAVASKVEGDVLPPNTDLTSKNASRPSSHRRSSSNPVSRLHPQEIVEISSDIPCEQTRAADIPPTPELAYASLTATPISAQPITPMHASRLPLPNSNSSMHEGPAFRHDDSASGFCNRGDMHVKQGDGFERHSPAEHTLVDPKTVFVGGLEASGPNIWDETRLRAVFERYGEVRDVRIINTSGKKTFFAFITFADQESPTRAIHAEHNRCYEGRAIRVQLRDINPQRGSYRGRGRGSARFRHFGFEPHLNGGFRHAGRQSEHMGMRLGGVREQPLSNNGDTPFKVNMDAIAHLPSSSSGGTDSATLLSSSSSFDFKADIDASRESDAHTAISLTPPPSLSTSASVASATTQALVVSAQQPVPPLYYPPQAWASPYGAPVQFSTPYSAYGGGIYPSVPIQYATPPHTGDTAGATLPNTQAQWNAAYRAAIPYTHFPYIPTCMLPAPETARLHAAALGTSAVTPSTPSKDRPPLHATGFLQGEDGTLIPVYHPEALNEYMSGSSPALQQTRGMPSSTSPNSASSPTLGRAQSSVNWTQGYPPAPIYTTYPVPPVGASSQSGSMSNFAASMATMQQQVLHNQPHGQSSSTSLTPSAQWGTPSAFNIGLNQTHMFTGNQLSSGLSMAPRMIPCQTGPSPQAGRTSQRRDVSMPNNRPYNGMRTPPSSVRSSTRSLSSSGAPSHTPTRQRGGPNGHQVNYDNGKYLSEGARVHQQFHPQWTANPSQPQ